MQLSTKILDIYQVFFQEIASLEIPDEKIATCQSCTLCQSKNSPYSDSKCCNYFPQLSSFLVGGILNDPEVRKGKKNILKLIKAKKGVTPYGIFPNLDYAKQRRAFIKKNLKNQTKSEIDTLLCPYLDQGNCTVWKYRENLCVTFFCSSIGGTNGQQFWGKFNNLIKLTEKKLAQYVLIQLGWKPEDINLNEFHPRHYNTEKEDFTLDPEKYDAFWKNWKGREIEFYTQAFELVKNLTLNDFKSILGQDYHIVIQAIKNKSYSFLKNEFPTYLVLNPRIAIKTSEDYVTYKLGNEEITIDQGLYMLFRLFDGKNTTESIIRKSIALFLNLGAQIELFLEKKFLLVSNV
jgi:hypothetical protein